MKIRRKYKGVIYEDYMDIDKTGEVRGKCLQEISECKSLLAGTDYKVIKNAECMALGMPYPYNAEDLHKERQALRDRINELERELE